MKRTLTFSRLFLATSIAAIVGCSASTDDRSPDGTTGRTEQAATGANDADLARMLPIDEDPPFVDEPGGFVVHEVGSGDGWTRFQITGAAPDEAGAMRFASDVVTALTTKKAADDARLPQVAKQAIGDEPLGEDEMVVVHDASAARAQEIVNDEAAKAAAADAPSAAPEAKTAQPASALFGASDESYVRSVTYTYPFNQHWGAGDKNLSGNIDVSGSATVSAQAGVILNVTRVFGAPVAFKFRRALLAGSAKLHTELRASATLDAAFHASREVAKPELGGLSFWLGAIPVYVGFNVPVEVGLDASAKGRAEISQTMDASGGFDVSCNGVTCVGTRSGNVVFKNNGVPQMTAEARVRVSPYVQVALRAFLYTEGVAYGQAGLRGTLNNDVWAYAGNTCGDANGDGTSEFVSALTLDASVDASVVAKAQLFGGEVGPWDWKVYHKHVAFWDLLGHSTALDPMVRTTLSPNGDVQSTFSMRPCLPWDDDVNVNYSFAAGTQPVQAATAMWKTPVNRSFPRSEGNVPVTVQAIDDSDGRAINGRTDVVWTPDGQTPCGQKGLVCCARTQACGLGLDCRNGTCQDACGGLSQACCASGSSCNSGLTCRAGICQPPAPACGASGQACCATGTPCDLGLTCRSGKCTAPDPCGGVWQACCTTGRACTAARTICEEGICERRVIGKSPIIGNPPIELD